MSTKSFRSTGPLSLQRSQMSFDSVVIGNARTHPARMGVRLVVVASDNWNHLCLVEPGPHRKDVGIHL
jgi:hypothetical protein